MSETDSITFLNDDGKQPARVMDFIRTSRRWLHDLAIDYDAELVNSQPPSPQVYAAKALDSIAKNITTPTHQITARKLSEQTDVLFALDNYLSFDTAVNNAGEPITLNGLQCISMALENPRYLADRIRSNAKDTFQSQQQIGHFSSNQSAHNVLAELIKRAERDILPFSVDIILGLEKDTIFPEQPGFAELVSQGIDNATIFNYFYDEIEMQQYMALAYEITMAKVQLLTDQYLGGSAIPAPTIERAKIKMADPRRERVAAKLRLVADVLTERQ